MLSPVLPWSPGPECTILLDCWDGFSLLICSESHISNRGVAILILINTIKFRIVEMVSWLNLNKRPCLGLDPWPFRIWGKPINPGLRYGNATSTSNTHNSYQPAWHLPLTSYQLMQSNLPLACWSLWLEPNMSLLYISCDIQQATANQHTLCFTCFHTRCFPVFIIGQQTCVIFACRDSLGPCQCRHIQDDVSF